MLPEIELSSIPGNRVMPVDQSNYEVAFNKFLNY